MPITDPETGISVRFVRSWDPTRAPLESTRFDQALMLVLATPRDDVPFAEQLADALRFLRSRVH